MLAFSQNQTQLYMQAHATTDEKVLCAAWFIALFFLVLQIVLMYDFDQDIRRSRRIKVRTEQNRTIRIPKAKTKRKEAA